MERSLRILAVGFVLIGVAVICLGLYLIYFALFTPAQLPPIVNEGLGMAWSVGLMITVAGLLSFSIGLAIRWGLKTPTDPAAAVEPAVAADDRRSGTLDR